MNMNLCFRSKSDTIDYREIYRDCNAASHYLEDSLTTNKCKGPLKGKILVSACLAFFLIPGIKRPLSGCIVVALLVKVGRIVLHERILQYFSSATHLVCHCHRDRLSNCLEPQLLLTLIVDLYSTLSSWP